MLSIVARSSRSTASRSSVTRRYFSVIRSPTPSGLSSLRRMRPSSSRVSKMYVLERSEPARLPEARALLRIALAERLRLLRQQRRDREQIRG